MKIIFQEKIGINIKAIIQTVYHNLQLPVIYCLHYHVVHRDVLHNDCISEEKQRLSDLAKMSLYCVCGLSELSCCLPFWITFFYPWSYFGEHNVIRTPQTLWPKKQTLCPGNHLGLLVIISDQSRWSSCLQCKHTSGQCEHVRTHNKEQIFKLPFVSSHWFLNKIPYGTNPCSRLIHPVCPLTKTDTNSP